MEIPVEIHTGSSVSKHIVEWSHSDRFGFKRTRRLGQDPALMTGPAIFVYFLEVKGLAF